jgi:hypothetical protein
MPEYTGSSGLLNTAPAPSGAFGDGMTDDTLALQAWINDIPAGGAGTLPSGRYVISAPLVISKPCTIQGMGAHFLHLAQSLGSTNWPSVAPYIVGAVIIPRTPGQDGIQITVAASSVNLFDFGILFDQSFLGVAPNTGHGFNATPATYGSYKDTGLLNFNWRNLKVTGHDGNHYGFVLTNFLNARCESLHSYGGGGKLLSQNSNYTNWGNTLFLDNYAQVMAGGSAHGVYMQNLGPDVQNFNCFVREQTFVLPGTGLLALNWPSPTSAQANLQCDSAVTTHGFISPDFETTVGSIANYPTAGGYATSGGRPNPSGGMQANPVSGTGYQNTLGTSVMYFITVTLNPTGIAAATVLAQTGATSGTITSQVGIASMPAAGPVGSQQTVNFFVGAGGWFSVTFTNAVQSMSAVYTRQIL